MRVDVLTREYPPHVYGGAGVHVTELARVLRGRVDLRVRCFDGPRDEPAVTGYVPCETSGDAVFDALAVDLAMARDCAGADIVHSHTWYANGAGLLASVGNAIPHVITAHSLEPLRPWKADQLGAGYRLSSWIERTAYKAADAILAVSAGMRSDVLSVYPEVDPDRVHVVHNGVDLETWRPLAEGEREAGREALRRHGVDANRPSVAFVGRMTRQKGLVHLLRAAERLPGDVQVIICAGGADTPEEAAATRAVAERLASRRDGIRWIEGMLPRFEVRAILDAASVFACPSVYEPLGIVNLEAMAMGLPVVASAVGGIPEVVVDGETGVLVPLALAPGGIEPTDADGFEAAFADALSGVLSDPERALKMGAAGLERARTTFAWDAVADRTIEVYRAVENGGSSSSTTAERG